MKPSVFWTGRRFCLGALLCLVLAGSDRAQDSGGNVKNLRTSRFVSDQYFDPPNQQQLKIRLSGASADPLPGGAQDLRDLKIERYDLNGKLEVTVRAPQCTYALLDGVASSSGHFEMQTGDGRIYTEGVGFLWRQSDNSFIISNQVHTIIHAGTLKLLVP